MVVPDLVYLPQVRDLTDERCCSLLFCEVSDTKRLRQGSDAIMRNNGRLSSTIRDRNFIFT